MNSSEVLRFLGRKSNKFKQWSLRAKLFKYTNAEKLPDTSSREYNLYQQTVNKLSNNSYHFNGFYSFSPTRQTLTAGVIINASRHGLVIDVANTNMLKLIRDVEYCLLPSDSDVVYVKQDFESMKPHQLWHGKMEDDDGNDQLVFQNNSKSHQMNVTLSRDFRFIFITLLSRLHSEVYVLPSDMSQLPLLVAPPQKMIFYFMEHAHGRFYILTNCGENGGYKLMTSFTSSPDNWTSLYAPDKDEFILQDMEVFDSFLALYGTTPTLSPAVIIKPTHDTDYNQLITFDGYTHVHKLPIEYKSSSITISLSSPVSPPVKCIIDKNGRHETGKFVKGKFEMAKINVPAEDGVKIPITLLFDISKLKMDGTNPLLVRVYGCHGVSLYTGYDGTMLPLLDDGWIIAYCHVRGGNELGKQWHLQAIQDNKPITFKDLLVCVSALHSLGYSSPQLTAAFGISSGALSVAMACNYNPKIFGSVILEMPLVNLCDNLMNNNHYINSMDEDEFGNIRSNLKLVKSLCPFSNLKPQDYPSYFITASTIDPLISINGVDKYVDKLKDSISEYMRCHPPINDVGIARYLPRGTVLYQKISHHGHWANSNDRYHRQQGLLRILFLNQTIHNYMYY